MKTEDVGIGFYSGALFKVANVDTGNKSLRNYCNKHYILTDDNKSALRVNIYDVTQWSMGNI